MSELPKGREKEPFCKVGLSGKKKKIVMNIE